MALTPEEIEERLDDLQDDIGRLARRVRNNPLDPTLALSRDLVDLGEVPSIRMRQTTQQTLSDNTATQISLQVTDWDTMNGADLGNNDIIIRRSGIYLIMGGVRFVVNTTGDRQAGWTVNDTGGGDFLRQSFIPASNSSKPIFCELLDLTVGDTVQLVGSQTSGGNLATLPLDGKIGIPFLSLVLIADLPSNLA